MLDDCGSTWGLAEYILKLTDQGLEFCLLGRRQLRIHVHYRMGCLGERSELLRAGNPLLEQVDMVNLFRSSAAGLPHSVRDRPHSFQNHVGPLPGHQELTGSCRDQNHHTVSRLELPGLGVPVVETLFGMLGGNEVFSDEGHDSLNSFSHPPYVLDEGALGGALAAQTLGGALAAQTLGGALAARSWTGPAGTTESWTGPAEKQERACEERPQEGAVLELAQEGAVLEQAQEGAVLEQAQEGAVLEQAQEGAVLEQAQEGIVLEQAQEGAQEAQTLRGAREARTLGGAREARTLGGAREERTLGGAREERTLGGAREARTLGGVWEARTLGGAWEAWVPGLGAQQPVVLALLRTAAQG